MGNQNVQTAHVYRSYEETNRFAIEVAIADYNEIFNEWDPAPFKRRGLNPELQYFLDECSNDISIRHPLAIVFYIPSAELDPKKEEFCLTGIRNHFAFKMHVLNKEQREVMLGVLKNTLIGILFLCTAIIFDSFTIENLFLRLLREGLFIGGWVFIWEALATVGFKNRELKHTIKECERFLDAPIVFKNEQLPEQQQK